MLSAPRQFQNQQQLMKSKPWMESLCRSPIRMFQAHLPWEMLCSWAALQVLWWASLEWESAQGILQLQTRVEQAVKAQSSAGKHPSPQRVTQSSSQALPHSRLNVLGLQVHTWKAFPFPTLTSGSRRARSRGNPLQTLMLVTALPKIPFQSGTVQLFPLLPRS